MKQITENDLLKLAEPMPYKWRVQSYSKNSAVATCVAYIDARDVQKRLDDVVGVANWQTDFFSIEGVMFCKLSIRINGEWVSKCDTGSESNMEKDKGLISDCLKRAAVNFGIGRFLYDIPIQFVKTNEPKNDNNYPYAVDDKGNKIKDLSLHINKTFNKITNFKPKEKDVITQINECTNLDELREIRAKYTDIESTDTVYKQALMTKYQELQPTKVI